MGEAFITRRGGIVTSKKLVIYDNGDECIAVTGGWVKGGFNRGAPTFTKNVDHIKLYANDMNTCISIIPDNAITLSQYNKMCATLTCSGVLYNDGIWSGIGIDSVKTIHSTSEAAQEKAYLMLQEISNVKKDFTLDISNLNISGYPRIACSSGYNNQHTILIHKIWLEE